MTQKEIVQFLKHYECFKVGHYLADDEVLPHAIRKLCEEVGALTEDIMQNSYTILVGQEIADIYLILCRIAEFYGLEITKIVDTELLILQNRMDREGSIQAHEQKGATP